MKFLGILVSATFLIVAAGQSMAATDGNSEPTALDQPRLTAPEYMPCRHVRSALEQADAVVRNVDKLQEAEANFWYSRRDRLVKRAEKCTS